MREIIFRGKRIDNGEWVEGNLFIPDNPDTPTQICIGTCITRICYEIDPETVGEYTGLTDKNGKKIFEGDIVQDIFINSGKKHLVKFTTEYEVGYNPFCEVCHGLELLLEPEDCKVIGNMHDNPELLRSEQE